VSKDVIFQCCVTLVVKILLEKLFAKKLKMCDFPLQSWRTDIFIKSE